MSKFFSGPKIFSDPKFFCGHKILSDPKKFLDPKFFRTQNELQRKRSLEGKNRVQSLWLSKLARAKVLFKLEFDTEDQVLLGIIFCSNTSGFTGPILTKLWDPIFVGQPFCWTKLLLTQIFFGPKYFCTQFF